ncbi:hypothetical protein AG1IA_04695 [Rhizoctonia solani AG-1 IA]|uniref:Uncharacterized protein n=1 Tax=Thanatephorus cucumeris (strain AG1-IA) TaxID=983506 RepID=L8WTI8_THACA|nr:hypothetical protein AG1IA_04695 [Rhizoctonia solani AG-1 IA]
MVRSRSIRTPMRHSLATMVEGYRLVVSPNPHPTRRRFIGIQNIGFQEFSSCVSKAICLNRVALSSYSDCLQVFSLLVALLSCPEFMTKEQEIHGHRLPHAYPSTTGRSRPMLIFPFSSTQAQPFERGCDYVILYKYPIYSNTITPVTPSRSRSSALRSVRSPCLGLDGSANITDSPISCVAINANWTTCRLPGDLSEERRGLFLVSLLYVYGCSRLWGCSPASAFLHRSGLGVRRHVSSDECPLATLTVPGTYHIPFDRNTGWTPKRGSSPSLLTRQRDYLTFPFWLIHVPVEICFARQAASTRPKLQAHWDLHSIALRDIRAAFAGTRTGVDEPPEELRPDISTMTRFWIRSSNQYGGSGLGSCLRSIADLRIGPPQSSHTYHSIQLRALTSGKLPQTMSSAIPPQNHPLVPQFSNGYSGLAQHAAKEIREMAISQDSIGNDFTVLKSWMRKFNQKLKPNARWYFDKGQYSADTNAIREVMQRSRNAPTAIYRMKSLDIQRCRMTKGPRSYWPVGVNAHIMGTEVIDWRLKEMRQLLFEGPHLQSGPLLLTFGLEPPSVHHRGLPYVLECNGNEPQWRETKYHDGYVENSDDIVSMTGCVYENASTNAANPRCILLPPLLESVRRYSGVDEALSLSEIIKRLSEKITEHGQRPRTATDLLFEENGEVKSYDVAGRLLTAWL